MPFEHDTLERDASKPRQERRWIWRNRIPHLKVTLVNGDWGIGKTHSLASALTCIMLNEELPDGQMPGEEAADILIVTTESDKEELGDIFEAQGCSNEQLAHIHRLGFVVEQGNKYVFDLDRNMTILETEIRKWHPLVIIFDPLVQFHNRKEIDTHSIRGLMVMLDELCQKWQVSIIGLIHWNKNEKLTNRSRMAGSHQYAAAVKSVITVFRDSKNKDLRHFYQEKMTLGPEPDEICFTIEPPDGLVQWIKPEGVKPPAMISEAQKWLMDNLSDPRPISWCIQESGFSERTLRRARHDLGLLIVTTEKFVDFKHTAHWELASERNLWGVFTISTAAPSGH